MRIVSGFQVSDILVFPFTGRIPYRSMTQCSLGAFGQAIKFALTVINKLSGFISGQAFSGQQNTAFRTWDTASFFSCLPAYSDNNLQISPSVLGFEQLVAIFLH